LMTFMERIVRVAVTIAVSDMIKPCRILLSLPLRPKAWPKHLLWRDTIAPAA
jgi:hypothetical protein